jgi:hypothetical protein
MTTQKHFCTCRHRCRGAKWVLLSTYQQHRVYCLSHDFIQSLSPPVQPASNNIEGSNWTTTNGNLAVENGSSVRHLIILIYWLENNYKSTQNISNRSPSISLIESRASVSPSDVHTPLAGDTGPELNDVVNMSLNFGNMSFNKQPNPLDSKHCPPVL